MLASLISSYCLAAAVFWILLLFSLSQKKTPEIQVKITFKILRIIEAKNIIDLCNKNFSRNFGNFSYTLN